MFFDVKANLSPEQLRRLRRAGVTRLPGETDADYLEQAEIMPALHHLAPPLGYGELWLERFSPYYAAPPEEFSDIRPRQAYSFIYPVPDLDLTKIAYFFDHTPNSRVSPEARTALADAVQAWRDRWSPDRPGPALQYQRGPCWIRLIGSRGPRRTEQFLGDWHAAVYEAGGDSPRTASGLVRRLTEAGELTRVPQVAEITEFLDSCAAHRTVLREGSRYLALALPTARVA